MSFKSTDPFIYNIRHITMKSLVHVNIDSESPLYLIFNNVDEYIQESNGDKYLAFAFTEKNKKVLGKLSGIKVRIFFRKHVEKKALVPSW